MKKHIVIVYMPNKSMYPKKPIANKKPKRKVLKNKTMNMNSVKALVAREVNRTREIKRLWGEINTNESANVVTVPTGSLVPSFIFSEGTAAYVTSCLNLTKQGLENENRIGNSIQPLRFTLKGYGQYQKLLTRIQYSLSHT